MSYSTDFQGSFSLDTPLSAAQVAYLRKFSETRRMKRDAKKASKMSDPTRKAVKLPIGAEGCYFVGGAGFAGQDSDESILDYNNGPKGQPNLWCQWIPTEDGTAIVWDGGDKFYEYVEWLEYIIEHFLNRWGLVLNGTVEWRGEESDDFGKIIVENNVVKTKQGRKVYR